MSLIIKKVAKNSQQQNSAPAKIKNKSGHTQPRQPAISLEQTGRLRVANMLAILNVSHATFYAGLKTGRYPSHDGKDGSFPYWMTSSIKSFLESGNDIES